MKPFRAISVDDEPGAHQVLATLLTPVRDVVLADMLTSAVAAREALATGEYDLLFLDISMPQMNGLDLLRSLSAPPITILLTAHSEYAIEAFELGVRDYLLKPVSSARLQACLDNTRPLLLAARQSAGNVPARLAIKTGLERQLVDPAQITHVQAEGNFSVVHADVERVFASESMKELEHRLAPFGFLRVHKSYLVNVRHVKALRANELELSEGTRVPVGRMYRSTTMAELDKQRIAP